MSSQINSLTEEHQAFILKKIEEGFIDYVVIANLLFGRDDLKGRDQESKLVRDFMIECGAVKKRGSGVARTPQTLLSQNNIEFIDENIKSKLSPKQATLLLFPEEFKDPKKNANIYLSPQYKAVFQYIRDTHPEYLTENESATIDKYVVPRSISAVLRKVNRWCSQDLEESRLSSNSRKCLDKLISYLNSPRFIQNYDTYRSESDKDLFEAEFVRATWDKPDLTIDEINMYVNVCMEYVNLKQIDSKKNKVNDMFHETTDQKDMTIRLVEILKTISEEYNQCSARIDKMLQKLNGERSKRVGDQQQRNASILNLVEAFQDENERKLMIKIADMQKQAVQQECDRLENMASWKARIIGISKQDAI